MTEPVVSPTFTLVRQYRGTYPVYHLDVYRLERVQDVIDLGFEEILDPEGVSFVEWGDAIEGLLLDDYLEVEMWTRAEDEGRLVVVTGTGRAWAERWERLEGATLPWAALVAFPLDETLRSVTWPRSWAEGHFGWKKYDPTTAPRSRRRSKRRQRR